MVGAAYFRLSPILTKDIQLDETRSDQLVQMLWETKAYIYNNRGDFKKIAQLLKAWVETVFVACDSIQIVCCWLVHIHLNLSINVL